MAEVGALRVSLTLDSADFSRSMQDINRKLKGLQSEFKASTAGNKLFENSLDGMKLKSNHLSQVLALQKERVEQLRKQYEQSVATKGADAKETENLLIRYNNALAAMKNTESQLNSLNSQIQVQSSSWYKLGETLKNVGNSVNSIGESMKSVGQTMTTRVTLPVVGLGAAIIKTGADFEESMSKVAAISGATGKDFEKLKEQAKELGSKTKFSASEAASGMQFLAMAGFKTNEIMSAMPGLLDLAAAGAMDLGRAADITSNIMSGFGIEASKAGHVADVLAKASSSANTNVQQLGDAMVYLAPVSKTLGWTMEEATAAVMALSDAGIQGAQAGAAFSTSLGRLAKPTKEMQSVMKELGLSFFDAQGNMKPLPAVIAELERATKGMTAEQKSAVLTTLFGAEAYKHWSVLLDKGSQALDENTKMLINADGAAREMAETMSDNTNGAFKEFASAVEGLSIALSEHLLPYVTKIIKSLTDWVRKFAELDSSTQKIILVLAGIAAAIGPVLVATGMLLSSIGSIATAFGSLAGVIAKAGGVAQLFSLSVSSSFLPIVGIVLGVVAVAYTLYQAWKNNFGGIQDVTKNVWDAVVAKFNEVKSYVMPIIKDLVAYISERWKSIEPIVTTVMNAIGAIIKFILSFVLDTVKFYLDAVVNIFKGVFNIITGIVKFFSALFTGDWSGMWEAIKQVLLGAVQAIWGLFNLWFVGKIAGVIGQFVSRGIGFIRGFIDDGIGLFTRFVSDVFGKIAGWISSMVQAISSGMSSFANVIGTTLRNIIRDFVDFVMLIPRQLSGLISQMVSIGKDIVHGIWNGIQQMGSWLANQITNWAKTMIPGPIAKALGIQSPSRVMRDEIGKWIPLGLAEGIEKNVNAVMSATNRMVNATMPNLSSIEVSVASSTAAQSPVVSNPTIIIENMVVRNDEDIYRISRELYSLTQSSRKAKGMR